MSSAAAARKAWNDAMKASAPTHIRGAARPRKRRSERRARTGGGKATHAATSAAESVELQRAVWLDALEEVDAQAQDGGAAAAEDDDAYNEYEDLEAEGDTAKSKRRKPSRKASAPKKAAAAHKRFLPRSLGTILLEEANATASGDSVAHEFLRVQAVTSTPLPARNFCPVTGLPGLFRDPKSGLWYSSYAALEQIRERPPPWRTLAGGGSSNATYYEAVKSLQDSSTTPTS